MGGGIALLCGQALAIWHPDLAKRIEGIYTFGSPHLGDAAFCRQFVETLGRKALNFTHGVDIVPRLPPRLLQYSDACYQEWYLTTTGRVHVQESQVRCPLLPCWQNVGADLKGCGDVGCRGLYGSVRQKQEDALLGAPLLITSLLDLPGALMDGHDSLETISRKSNFQEASACQSLACSRLALRWRLHHEAA